MANGIVSWTLRAILILMLPSLALVIVVGLAQMKLSWQHRNKPVRLVCPLCDGEIDPFWKCELCDDRGVIEK